MARTGIYSLEDLLAQRFTPASDFGLDKIADVIQARLDWLNGQVNDQMGLLAETSDDVRRVWGGNAAFEMKEVDEYGEARTQKATSGVEVNFPLRKFSVSTGWTADFMRRATPRDLALSVIGIENAYLERLQAEIKFALYNKDNYSITDKFGDRTSLSVKAFLNADSAAIPDAPDGTSFNGASHTHYNGTASLAVSDIDALISDVVEHGLTKGVTLFIPAGMVSTLEGLSGTKFVKLTSSLLVPASDSIHAVSRIDPEADLNNVLVGYWDGRVPVVTRSWAVANYIVCVATGAAEKPLVRRVDRIESLRGLVPTVEYGLHPLTAKSYEAFVGFGAFNRAAVAILDTANSSYTEPTLIR
jgi:hypothetical protein